MFLMNNRLRSYRRACGKLMPVEAKALACGCNGTSETFSNEAGKPAREGGSPLGLPMGRMSISISQKGQ